MIRCLVINGSHRGSAGNSAQLISAWTVLPVEFEYQILNLVDSTNWQQIEPLLEWAEAMVVVSGTYWDSWGWPLQRFLESATLSEGTDLWLGKPVAVLITMHSVGGKGVLSRLQGVLNTLGAMIPPMCGIVISAVGQVALKVADPELANDIWRTSDLSIVAANLQCAAVRNRINSTLPFQTWDVDRTGFENVWLEVGNEN